MENNQQPINFFKLFKNPLVLIFFGVVLFYGRLLFGDMPYFGDYLTYQLPEKVLIRDCLQHGIMPFTNPYILSGTPMMSNIATGSLNPMNLLLLLGSPVFGFNFFLFVHVLLAGWAMYILVKRGLSLDKNVACLTGVSYSLGGVLWGMIDKGFIVSAWLIPLFFFGLLSLYSGNLRKKYSWLIAVLALTWLFYSGNLLETYFSIIVAGVGVIWAELCLKSNKKEMLKSVLHYCWIVLTGILLSAPQLLATYQAAKISYRSAGVGVDMAQNWSFPLARSIEFLIPFAFGGRENGGMYFGDFYVSDAQGAAGSPWFDSVFFGFPLLCTVIFLLINYLMNLRKKEGDHEKVKTFQKPLFILSLGLLFFFLLSLGKLLPLYKICYFVLPGFKVFRHPEKFLEWVNIFLIIIGAFGLDRILKTKNSSHWSVLGKIVLTMLCFILMVFATALVLFLIFPGKYSTFFQSYACRWNGEQIFLWQAGTMLISMIFLTLMFVALRLYKARPKRIIISFIWISLLNFVCLSRFVDWTVSQAMFKSTPTWDEKLPEFDKSQWRIYFSKQFRYIPSTPKLAIYASLADNTASLRELRIPNGFSALLEQKYVDYFNFEKHPPMRVMDLLSVRYIGAPLLGEEKVPPGCKVLHKDESRKLMILENPHARPRIAAYTKYVQREKNKLTKALFFPESRAEDYLLLTKLPSNFQGQSFGKNPQVNILDDVPGHIQLRLTGGPAFVVVRDWFSPGWVCRDEQGEVIPLVKADGGLLGVFCAREKAVLNMKYSPPGFKNGMLILFIGIAALFFGFLIYSAPIHKLGQ